jgi:hypothetical protein
MLTDRETWGRKGGRKALVAWRCAEEASALTEFSRRVPNLAAEYERRRRSKAHDGGMSERDTRRSRWSIASEDSFLSIASKNSVLSIGSVGSALSVGSIGSFGSLLAIGSFCSLGSVLSAASAWSVLSWRAKKGLAQAHSS